MCDFSGAELTLAGCKGDGGACATRNQARKCTKVVVKKDVLENGDNNNNKRSDLQPSNSSRVHVLKKESVLQITAAEAIVGRISFFVVLPNEECSLIAEPASPHLGAENRPFFVFWGHTANAFHSRGRDSPGSRNGGSCVPLQTLTSHISEPAPAA